MATTVEQELLAVLKEKGKGKKETPADFHVRVANALSDEARVTDEDYQKLSAGAQAWFKQAADIMSADPVEPDSIKPFSEFDILNAEEKKATKGRLAKVAGDKTAAAPTPEPEKKGKKEKKEKAAPPPKEEEGKETKTTKATGVVRASSVADQIREILCDNPELSKEDVGKVLKERKMSYDQSRLDQVYSATNRVLEILKSKGKIK